MFESNNPEIDVNELMERVHAEVARRRELGSPPRNGSGDAAPTVLPQVPFLTPLPPVASPRRVDVKEERLTSILQRAREKTEVSRRIPKLLRRFFRKQGGYNKLLLESVAVLTKTNVELNKRLQELASGFEIQNRWLSDLSNTRAANTAWMRAAATIIASVPQQRSEFDHACEHLRSLQAQADGMREVLDSSVALQTEQLNMQIKLGVQINDVRTERHIAAESARTLRSEFDRACEHLRSLQAQADGTRKVLDSSLARQTEQLDMQSKLGVQINDVHTERHIAAESARTLRSEFDRACEHLRSLQAQADGMCEVLDSSLARQTEQLDMQIKLGVQINDVRTERHIAAESARTLRSEFDRACEHLRSLQDMQIKLGVQINDVHTEHHLAAESARTLRSEFDRACEHLRSLQDMEIKLGVQINDVRTERHIAAESARTLRSEFDRACEHLRSLQDMQIKLGVQINDVHTEHHLAAESARTLRSEFDRAC